MIEIELIGGPNDGMVMKVDQHSEKWLIPQPCIPLPIACKPEDAMAVDMHVAVYEKIPGHNKYRFYRMEVW